MDEEALSLSALSDAQATTFPGIGREMPLRMPVRSYSNSRHPTPFSEAGLSPGDSGYGTASGPSDVNKVKEEAADEGSRGHYSLRSGEEQGLDGSAALVREMIDPASSSSHHPTAGEVGDDEDDDEDDDKAVEFDVRNAF